MANIVLGSGSTTVPSTSIASRLATGSCGSLSQHECRPGRADTRTHIVSENAICRLDGCGDLGAILGHRDGVLEMRREGAVRGDDGPAVIENRDVPAPEREHRLDRETHP